MTMKTLKAYWQDGDQGTSSDAAVTVSLEQAQLIWSDEIRGIEGNFLGLIDDRDNTIQFYFVSDIPDDVDDASQLRIVLLDFPIEKQRGSYAKEVAIGEVHDLIAKAFAVGAKHEAFEGLRFEKW
jgi:hypothetical protein